MDKESAATGRERLQPSLIEEMPSIQESNQTESVLAKLAGRSDIGSIGVTQS